MGAPGPETEYYTLIATDDAGGYVYEGCDGHVMVRGAEGEVPAG